MRKKYLLSLTISLFCLYAIGQRKTCIDADWKFYYGDGSVALSNDAATSQWRSLDLPHDWSVENEASSKSGGTVIGPFTTNSIGGHQTGFTAGGEGWYFKSLSINKSDLKNKRYELYVEGAYNQSKVYVNSHEAKENVYGYMSYKADITQYLNEGSNSILIQVKNEGNNTRWYAGSGLYRHVWLISTPLVYAEEWDTYVQPSKTQIKVSTTVHNQTDRSQKAKVSVEIQDASGRSVARSEKECVISSSGNTPVDLNATLQNAKEWCPDNPYLYTAILKVTTKGQKKSDILTKRFGIRSLAFNVDQGFLLNGSPILLRGGCIHHDNGLLGAAAYNRAETRKLELLKSQGYNAIRCSHNIPSEHFLDACDSIGLMVIDEAFDQWLRKKNDDDYHRFFPTHSSDDVKTMVRRDRNHPCVIMWSIGNEIPGRIEPAGMEAASRLRDAVKSLDSTRPVTAAICSWDEGDEWNSQSQNWDIQDSKAFESLDVGGYNYLFFRYEHDHTTHPSRVMFGAESFPQSASQNWDLVERLPYVIGDFVWTAMDYLGEAGIGSSSIRNEGQQTFFQEWPWFNGWCGDLDLIGEKKPQSYYRDVIWRQKPITMAVEGYQAEGYYQSVSLWGWPIEYQNWTYPDLPEGNKLNVNVYSRSARVRLYLNDELVGEKETSPTYQAKFTVGYHSGVLRAVNVDASGNEIAGETYKIETTGKAVSIRLRADRDAINADGQDLSYVTIELVDDKGRVVTSDSQTQVHISVEGNGTLLASGNGSPTDMESFRSANPKVYNGRALAIVKGSRVKGNITLNVSADGMGKSSTTIKTTGK